MPNTTNLNTLTINHVASQEVYDAMAAQNLINENELYLIPGDFSIDVDSTPGGTENSEALITSGATYAGLATKANKQNAIYFVAGTQNAATATWTGTLRAVDSLYDGLTIAYWLPVAGTSTAATLTLILGNNVETAAEPVYYTGTSRATTHFAAGSVVLLTWVSNATTGYTAVGSATGRWLHANYVDGNTIPASSCATGASTAAKTASHTYYTAKANSYTLVTLRYANTAKSALTLNINSTGAKPIYINGVASSSTNYTLPAGTYLVYYDGTNYYFRTDGKITGSITGDAATLNGRSDYLTGDNVAPANQEPTASWGDSVVLGTVANKEFKFTMPSDPNTHYTTHIYATDADGTNNAVTANGNTKIRVFDDTTARDSIGISGTGTVTVTSDNSGNITIAGASPSIDISTQTDVADWNSDVLVGKINNQEFKFKMPANPDTNTTYSLTQDNTDGHKITLTPSPSGTPQTITIPDNDHNYYHQSGSWDGLTYTADNTNAPNIELSFEIPTGADSTTVARGDHTHAASLATNAETTGVVNLTHGNQYKLTAGGGSVIFKLPTDNNTYMGSASFADDTTANANKPVKMTLKSTGTNTNIEVIGNIPKVSSSSAGVAPKGAVVNTQSQSTKFLREDGTWAAPSYTTNTNTDTLVKQNALNGANSGKAILMSDYSWGTTSAGVAKEAHVPSKLGYNDSSGVLYIGPTSKYATYSATGVSFTNSSNSYTTRLQSGTPTANVNITLPASGGTLALTSQIPDVSGKIDTAGTGLSKSGTTLNHSNSVTAQTTQAVYPIQIDAQGHISAYGSAPTTLSGYGITDAYTKTEVNNLVASVFHYKGTKATVSALPSSGNTTGDVWHITADGSEYVYNGSAWEELGTVVDLSGYAQLSGANFTGPVNFGDSVTADDVTTGSLVVTGNASFTNNINANTINGVTVGSNPKFTDTITTVTTSGNGNAITAISASNGAITATKGSTFLTSHQDISGKADKSATVSTVTWDSTNNKLTKTINGNATDVVTLATIKTALGSMPASDVYAWAKAATKPTYTASEVGAATSDHTHTTSISATGSNPTALSANTTYTLTAGGTTCVFKTPVNPDYSNTYAAKSHTHAWSDITSGNEDLKAIEALTGASGFLKKTAANTWSLDTTTYVPTTRTVNGHALSGNVSVTASDVGLGNLTNDKQVKGLSSGTTSGHIVTWGSDGYTVADSGKSFTTTTPTSSSTNNTIPTSKAVWAAINALAVSDITGFDPGATLASLSETDGKISATFQDIEITASQVSDLSITLNGGPTTTPSFYAPINNGNAGYILKANGQNNDGDDIPPTWIEAVPVTNGGTGMTAAGDVNAVVISNSTSITGAMQTVSSGDGAFYATGPDAKPQFGTLPVAQGGTGATTFTSGQLLIGNGTSAVGTRAITNNTTNTSITNNNINIPTMNTIYYGLAQINGASQNRGVSVYAPTTVGTSGKVLMSSGSGAPTWTSKSLVQIVRW